MCSAMIRNGEEEGEREREERRERGERREEREGKDVFALLILLDL